MWYVRSTQNCGTVCVNVTCNKITKKAKFYLTKHDYAFILGLEFCKMFKLVTISPVCTLQSVSLKPNQVEAVHITDESEVDYHNLKTKWKEHLPLGRKTGDPLNDLKQIFQKLLAVKRVFLKVRLASRSPLMQNQFSCPLVLYHNALCQNLRRNWTRWSKKESSDPAQKRLNVYTI